MLPTLVAETAAASRSEEQGSWRYPHDLAALLDDAAAALPDRLAAGMARDAFDHDTGVAELAWSILAEDPAEVVAAIDDAIDAGARPEELGRAVAYAAALRITRFHTQNDHGDWDAVHHAFTAANAVHQALVRAPTPELVRGVYHGALRVYLDRFLNVPAARLPGSVRRPRFRSRRAAGVLGPGGRRRRGRRASSTGTSPQAATPGSRSRRSATPSSPRTPSSTGSRPTRPRCASSTPGPRAPRRAR